MRAGDGTAVICHRLDVPKDGTRVVTDVAKGGVAVGSLPMANPSGATAIRCCRLTIAERRSSREQDLVEPACIGRRAGSSYERRRWRREGSAGRRIGQRVHIY